MPDRPYGQRGKISIGKSRRVEGLWTCRWCGSAIPKGSRRRSWCSSKCVEEWRERGDWNHIRDRIIKRDQVCRICGGQRYHRDFEIKADPSRPTVVPFTRLTSGWDVDHIVAVDDGGTDDPDNLRLLCRACHKDVTRIQRALKALRRKFSALLNQPAGTESERQDGPPK